jgi:predicted pyridoxine 5'-phosphate oxidase superfamily flavin-nucleotide-binding protein
MTRKYPEIAFTESVKAAQTEHGSRELGRRLASGAADDEHLSLAEIVFLGERDSFYLATVNEDGWPYIQFRGGPKGFLKVLDTSTLGYADYRGNRQYVSVGNLRADDRVALFFMDYPNRRRLKMFARAEVLDAGARPELRARLVDPAYPARIERLVLFHVVAFDWNCPQHITPRYTAEELGR